MPIEIRKVSTDSIEIIREIAHATWNISYKGMISDEQISYMLQMMYSPESLARQMNESGHQFLLYFENDIPLGFAAYAPLDKSINSAVRLHKLYVHPGHQRKHIGQSLINYIKHDIAGKTDTLELTVNRNNKAVGFYKKLGFNLRSEVDMDIGNGFFMRDYIMETTLV